MLKLSCRVLGGHVEVKLSSLSSVADVRVLAGSAQRLSKCCLLLLLLPLLYADANQALSFEKKLVAALDAAGVPVDDGATAEDATATVEASAEAAAGGDEPKKSGGVFGYLFGGGGARDEAEAEAESAEGELKGNTRAGLAPVSGSEKREGAIPKPW